MVKKYIKSFDGAKIYYHLSLKNPDKWLIFLHGFGGDLTAWQKERAHFSKLGISSIAIDLRGHGLSSRGQDQDFYRFENFAKDIHSVIKAEKIGKPIIIGHCFGGIVALYLQALFPDATRGLILVDTSFKPPFISNHQVSRVLSDSLFNILSKLAPDLQKGGHRNFNKYVNTADWDIKRIVSDILHTSIKTYLLLCRSMANLDASGLLKKISVPTLIIEGERDSIFPPIVAQQLKNRIKNSQLDLVDGANHIIVLNNPQDLEKSIEQFLNKLKFI